jgi:hypothetical protein
VDTRFLEAAKLTLPPDKQAGGPRKQVDTRFLEAAKLTLPPDKQAGAGMTVG